MSDLVEIGFWAATPDASTPVRPWPECSVDAAWAESKEAETVASYLELHGVIESYEQGYSWCRFCCAAPARSLGCCSFTDGRFVWPEGFAHYVRCHGVRPPAPFVEHILQAALRADCGANWPIRHGLMWDVESRAAIPLPRGTRDYLARMSNLRFSSEP